MLVSQRRNCEKCAAPVDRIEGLELFKLREPLYRRIKCKGNCVCLDCVEARLGRQLAFRDFAAYAAVNATDIWDTPRLALRKLPPRGRTFWKKLADNANCDEVELIAALQPIIRPFGLAIFTAKLNKRRRR